MTIRHNSSLGLIWPQEWPFISFKHIKLGNPDTQEDLSQERSGCTLHSGDESGAKREGREGKMFPNCGILPRTYSDMFSITNPCYLPTHFSRQTPGIRFIWIPMHV